MTRTIYNPKSPPPPLPPPTHLLSLSVSGGFGSPHVNPKLNPDHAIAFPAHYAQPIGPISNRARKTMPTYLELFTIYIYCILGLFTYIISPTKLY